LLLEGDARNWHGNLLQATKQAVNHDIAETELLAEYRPNSGEAYREAQTPTFRGRKPRDTGVYDHVAIIQEIGTVMKIQILTWNRRRSYGFYAVASVPVVCKGFAVVFSIIHRYVRPSGLFIWLIGRAFFYTPIQVLSRGRLFLG